MKNLENLKNELLSFYNVLKNLKHSGFTDHFSIPDIWPIDINDPRENNIIFDCTKRHTVQKQYKTRRKQLTNT